MEMIPEGFSPLALLHRELLYHDQDRAGPKAWGLLWGSSRPGVLLALDDGALSTHASIPFLVGDLETKISSLHLDNHLIRSKLSRLIHPPGVSCPHISIRWLCSVRLTRWAARVSRRACWLNWTTLTFLSECHAPCSWKESFTFPPNIIRER